MSAFSGQGVVSKVALTAAKPLASSGRCCRPVYYLLSSRVLSEIEPKGGNVYERFSAATGLASPLVHLTTVIHDEIRRLGGTGCCAFFQRFLESVPPGVDFSGFGFRFLNWYFYQIRQTMDISRPHCAVKPNPSLFRSLACAERAFLSICKGKSPCRGFLGRSFARDFTRSPRCSCEEGEGGYLGGRNLSISCVNTGFALASLSGPFPLLQTWPGTVVRASHLSEAGINFVVKGFFALLAVFPEERRRNFALVAARPCGCGAGKAIRPGTH